MKLKIGKGDTVEMITGNQKGTSGVVLAIDSKKMRLKIQGIKVMTHFDRGNGLQKKEAFVAYSNVKLLEKAKAKKAAKSKAKVDSKA